MDAHTLPSRVPSHSMSLSSERNLTPPLLDAISHPKKFLGNSHTPSVTVRERSKLALDVRALLVVELLVRLGLGEKVGGIGARGERGGGDRDRDREGGGRLAFVAHLRHRGGGLDGANRLRGLGGDADASLGGERELRDGGWAAEGGNRGQRARARGSTAGARRGPGRARDRGRGGGWRAFGGRLMRRTRRPRIFGARESRRRGSRRARSRRGTHRRGDGHGGHFELRAVVRSVRCAGAEMARARRGRAGRRTGDDPHPGYPDDQ